MKKRDIDDIDDIAKFLASVGKSTLFEYFGAAEDASDDDVTDAIQKRRAWAQGQQSNPKFRQEALWVIKNVRRSKAALITNRAAYLDAVRGESRDQGVEVLRVYLMGALATGVLSSRSESSAREKGRELGLDDATISATIDTMLAEHRARRAAGAETGKETGAGSRDAGAFVDHYAVLEVDDDADMAALERAYRERYRWARQLDDSRRAADMYARLDEAWRVLKDLPTRARYDAERQARLGREPRPSGPNLGTHGGQPERELDASDHAERRIGFASRDDEHDDPEITNSSIPAPPEAIGSTLGMGADRRSALPARPARLEVDGPETIEVTLRGKPLSRSFIVRKSGDAPMPGRVIVDRDWVEVEPARLDRAADEQTVTLTFHPGRMPRKRAVALVTVITDDGQRRAITVEASQQRSAVVWAATAALALGGVGAGAWWLLQPPPPAPPPPPSAELAVRVDPPAGKIFVSNELVNASGEVVLTEGLTPGDTVLVRVELDGFEPWSDEVLLPADGQAVYLTPSLTLIDRMQFQPKAGDLEADIDSALARRALGERRSQIAGCMHDHGRFEPGREVVLGLEASINNRGHIVGARFIPQEFEASSELLDCVRRQLRSLQLPLIQGDYAVISHNVRYTEPAADPSP